MSRNDKIELDSNKSAGAVFVIAAVVITALSLAVLADSMTKSIGRDEYMYCTAGVLTARGKMIYRDFSYAAQLPYHPLLYAVLFKALDTNRYLLVGRLSSCVCDVFILICIVGISRLMFRPHEITGTLAGLAGAVLYVFNPLVDYANGYAWNHDVVILCVMLSLWLFLSIDFQHKSRHWRIAVIGALLTFAACMRITTALVELLFFVIILNQPAASIKQRFRTALPFLAAAGVLLIWPVWIIAHAPQAFYLNLVKIPALYGRWLREIGMVYDKLKLTTVSLTTPAYLVLFVLAAYLIVTIVYLRRKLEKPDTRKCQLVVMLPIVFFVIALIPPTMWVQYLAMPVPFLVVGLVFGLSLLRKLTHRANVNFHFKVASVLLTVCVFIVVLSNPVVLYRMPLVAASEIWTPNKLHEVSQDMVDVMGGPRLTLTLAPLFALEGGCDIYIELSCGAIIYRIADSLTTEEVQITHTVGMESLGLLLAARQPPGAIITGMEMEQLEKPLVRVAGQDWLRKDYPDGPTLYYRNTRQ